LAADAFQALGEPGPAVSASPATEALRLRSVRHAQAVARLKFALEYWALDVPGECVDG
jgi:hypothetical protein